MMRMALVLAVATLLSGCKKKMEKEEPVIDFRADWKTLLDLREQMCSCTDEACTETTRTRLTSWKSTGAKRNYTPTDAQTTDVIRITNEIEACRVTAMSRVKVAPPAPEPGKPTLPAAPSGPAGVDELIALARGFAPAMNPQLVVSWIDAMYVDADGKLDEEDGYLAILLGPANASGDDPKRRVGAPVKKGPPPPTECVKLTWTKRSWSSEQSACVEAGRDFGRCAVVEIWKRAIAKGAPAEAVATVQLREGTPRKWIFTIVDEPRKISIQHYLPDDCELALEKQ